MIKQSPSFRQKQTHSRKTFKEAVIAALSRNLMTDFRRSNNA